MEEGDGLLLSIRTARAKLRRFETELALAKARLDDTPEAEAVATLRRQVKLARLEMEDALSEADGYGQPQLTMSLASAEVEINERSTR